MVNRDDVRAQLVPLLETLSPDPRATCDRLWGTVSPHLETMVRRPGETIRPPAEGAASITVERLWRSAGDRLVLESELGRGGMGVVRLATQSTVGRKVAVKTLRAADGGDPAALALLREGWTTGAVEHPNIVPVYDLDLDEGGRPLVVFKRIDGEPWSTFIARPEAVRERFGAEDVLEWHLRTLVQVCTAVEAAHRRGIIHRDLKPDNVMIATHGEVYVVDWGIAVSLRAEDEGRLPLASAATGMAGTPVYMAPEMFTGDGSALSERTDVYLLGGLLFAILTGQPPHAGRDPLSIMLGALQGPPPCPPDVSAELAAICRRALAPAPVDRQESATAFRQAIQRHLDHRHSERLTEEAEARLAQLEQLRGEVRAAVYNLFGACRFGFRLALESWSGNERARAGLNRAIEHMAARELDAGHPDAAEALLLELEVPAPALLARARAAREGAEAERRRLERLERDLDVRVGSRTRTLLALSLGLLWAGRPVWRIVTGAERTSYLSLALAPMVTLAVIALVGLFGRHVWLSTAYNRRIFAGAALAVASQCVAMMGAALADIPVQVSPMYEQFIGFLAVGLLAATVEIRLWPSSVGHLAGFLVAAAWPHLVDWCMAFNGALLASLAWLIWRRPLPERRQEA